MLRTGLVIPNKLPPETIALVETTAGQVVERRAAIIFRTWHKLGTEPARRLLFAQFSFGGHVMGLLDAIIATVRAGPWSGFVPVSPVPLAPADRVSLDAMLEGALIGALGEVLNTGAQVLNAWREAFRFFMRRLTQAS